MTELCEMNPWVFQENFQLDTFVETGIGNGSGTNVARGLPFKKIFTCDIIPAPAKALQGACADDPRVCIDICDSEEFLKNHLCEFGKTLFWLDAHFPNMYGGLPSMERDHGFPLLRELEILQRKQGIEHDVILCDDMRVIKDTRNPRWHEDEALQHFPAFIQHGLTIEMLTRGFEETHDSHISMCHQGVLTLVPKERPLD